MIVSYNGSAVKIYNGTNSIARFFATIKTLWPTTSLALQLYIPKSKDLLQEAILHTIVSYNSSAIKIYNGTNSAARF
jgi:hypothetical protein